MLFDFRKITERLHSLLPEVHGINVAVVRAVSWGLFACVSLSPTATEGVRADHGALGPEAPGFCPGDPWQREEERDGRG